MALALNNLKRVDMPLNKEEKGEQSGQRGPRSIGNEQVLFNIIKQLIGNWINK